MKTIFFGWGCLISEAAKRLVLEAVKTSGKVQGVFNDITLTADTNSTADGIVAYFSEEHERRSEAYRNSPEGKKAAAEAEAFR